MRQDIKERIGLIKNKKVPEGYKKTKLGIIPEQWEIVQIKDILEKVDNPVQVDEMQEYTQIGIRSHGKGIFFKEPVTGRELGNKRVFWVEPDCFVVNIVFAWEQAVARTTKEHIGMIASHRFPMYKSIDCKVMPDYLVYYFLTTTGKELMQEASPGGAGRNRTLGQERFIKSPIIFPGIDEQNGIVGILKSFDKQICLLGRMVMYKKQREEWLRENLLSGRKRLLGGDKSWRSEKLGEFLIEVTEKNKLKNILNVKSISNKLGFIKQSEQFSKEIASNDLSHYKIVKKGYVAYNPSRINVGSVAFYNESVEGIISPMYVVLRTTNELNEEYFVHYSKTNMFNHYMKFQLAGSVRETLKFDDLCAIKISLPSKEEQQAIVKVLETASREIKLFEKKLELIKQEKKAMMQLLLTGIVRVSETEMG